MHKRGDQISCCRWTGCIDWGCTLCRQNAKRCFHDLDPSQTLRSMKPGDRSGVTSSQLKSDCKQPFSVVVADLSAGSGATQSAASGMIVPSHLQVILLVSEKRLCKQPGYADHFCSINGIRRTFTPPDVCSVGQSWTTTMCKCMVI